MGLEKLFGARGNSPFSGRPLVLVLLLRALSTDRYVRKEGRGWKKEDGGKRMEERGRRKEGGGKRMEGRGWRTSDSQPH